MAEEFGAALRRAYRAVRSGDVSEVAGIMQQALGAPAEGSGREAGARMRWPLRDAVRLLREGRQPVVMPLPVLGAGLAPAVPLHEPEVRVAREERPVILQADPAPERPVAGVPVTPAVLKPAAFTERMQTGPGAARRYRLYVPTLPEGAAPEGLVLMLHGCGQNPEDFARGTRMNQVAEAHGLAVLYPEQMRTENAKGCWNWFRPGDQTAGSGEPGILASLVRRIVAELAVPTDRVFVAGLSAGGGMAAVLGAANPELFAAVGVHSGVPNGTANDALSALAVMRGDIGPGPRPKPGRVPLIVFHGSVDRTVNPVNADRVLAAAPRPAQVHTRHGAAGGRVFERTVALRTDGGPASERWIVEGTGHAWSGGDPAGSYSDAAGPDASSEMVRFFLAAAAHPPSVSHPVTAHRAGTPATPLRQASNRSI